jgi:hypothetical protein
MEIWKDIKEYEGYYQINQYGVVRRLKKNGFRIKKNVLDKDGYVCINLSKDKIIKGFKIHRLLAQSFIDNLNNFKEINHKNGIKNDNNISNLEWCDRSHNLKEAYKLGLKKFNMTDEVKNKIREKRLVNNHLYKRNKLGQYVKLD